MKIIKRKLSDIVVPERRRSIDHAKVLELAESIKIVGLLNPITIDKGGKLIAGGHRLEACRLLGHDEIECIVLDGGELHIELAEIDENLIRNDLDYISVGEMANRRNEILEALGLRAKVGDNQHTGGGAESALPKTTAKIAKEAGVSERVLQENMQLARELVPEAKKLCREKAIPKSKALKIAQMTQEQQQEVVEQLAQGKGINEVLPKRPPKQQQDDAANDTSVPEPPVEQPRIEPEEPGTEPIGSPVPVGDAPVTPTENASALPAPEPVVEPVAEPDTMQNAPAIPSTLNDRVLDALKVALELSANSKEQRAALLGVFKMIIMDSITRNSARRNLLKDLQIVIDEYRA